MVEQYMKLLSAEEVLQNNISKLIDIFCLYYGEDSRSFIEEKFSDFLFIPYQTPDNLNALLNQIDKEKSQELFLDVLQDQSILSKDDLFRSYTFRNASTFPIAVYQTFYEAYQMGEDMRYVSFLERGYQLFHRYFPSISYEAFYDMICDGKLSMEVESRCSDFLKEKFLYYFDKSHCEKEYLKLYTQAEPLMKKVDSSVNIHNFEEKLQNHDFDILVNSVERFASALKNFHDFDKELAQYRQYLEDAEEIQKDLSDKFMREFCAQFRDMVPSSCQAKFQDFIDGKCNFFSLPSSMHMVFVSFPHSTSISVLASFSKKSEALLKENANRTDIKYDRIRYFKMFGFDFGNNYEEYVNHPEIQKIWPSYDFVDQFIETREKYLHAYLKEYFCKLPKNQEIHKKIDALALLDKDDGFSERLYKRGGGCCATNLINTTHGIEAFSLLFLEIKSSFQNLDHPLIHELNHLLETSLLFIQNGEYKMISGWDYVGGKIGVNSDDEDFISASNKRDYELLNEAINELISQEICFLMEKNDLFVFSSKNSFSYQRETSYDNLFFLVQDFFQEFKEEILKSRRNANIDIIFQAVGKENFEQLALLCTSFYKRFPGSKINSLLSSLSNGIMDEDTQFYLECIEKRDTILQSMREHYRTMSFS